MDIYTHRGNEIVPISMSATPKDISSKLVVVRRRLLTRNAPITSELPNTIMTARIQKKTSATMSSVVIWGAGCCPRPPCGPAVEFVPFQDVVFSAIARRVVCRNVNESHDLDKNSYIKPGEQKEKGQKKIKLDKRDEGKVRIEQPKKASTF